MKSSRGEGSPLVTADRVLHNGLVKALADKDVDAFGKTATSNGATFAADLRDDITATEHDVFVSYAHIDDDPPARMQR